MELEEQQKTIEQQRLIDAIARHHSSQTGTSYLQNRDTMQERMREERYHTPPDHSEGGIDRAYDQLGNLGRRFK